MSRATLLLAFLSLSHFASGDTSLVQIVCRETDSPEVCLQCLISDPGADVATKTGIVAAVIDCLKGRGTSLESDMASISSASEDSLGKRVFGNCSESYSASNRGLASAAEMVKGEEYDGAEKAVTAALYRQDSCRDDIVAYKKVALSSKVTYKMKIYEALVKAVDRILERL